MFSKSKINEPGSKPGDSAAPSSGKPSAPPSPSAPQPTAGGGGLDVRPSAPKPKAPASTLSSDLHVKGNLKTTGDIIVEGQVEGDIRAHLLTIGEGATVKGELVADDVVINGRIVGRVRGLKVRLTSSARVEGDIIHKTIAIESGAHFEGSVQRQEDPLSTAAKTAAAMARPGDAPAAAPAPSGDKPSN